MEDLSGNPRPSTATNETRRPVTRIVGCGNANRSDDGVGVFVAQSLKTRLLHEPVFHVEVFDAGTGGIDVMFHARGAEVLVIVDAARTGSEPGTIFRVPGSELEADKDPGYSLHDFRWDHALAAGRKIFGDEFPDDVTVYLIEAQTVDYGLELTAPVRAAALCVIAEIERSIQGSNSSVIEPSCADRTGRGR